MYDPLGYLVPGNLMGLYSKLELAWLAVSIAAVSQSSRWDRRPTVYDGPVGIILCIMGCGHGCKKAPTGDC
jgi:hypothetical protein